MSYKPNEVQEMTVKTTNFFPEHFHCFHDNGGYLCSFQINIFDLELNFPFSLKKYVKNIIPIISIYLCLEYKFIFPL